MATPLSISNYEKAMRKWGVRYAPYKDWKDHNRNSVGNWGPVNGVMIHHTGSNSQKGMLETLRRGYEGLPGPLCHTGLDNSGKHHLIGWGRANHAGRGDSTVFSKVVSEHYSGNLRPTKADMDFNRHFYGTEIMYSGSSPMSDEQRESALLWAVAICDAHGWNEKSIIGHGEAQPGKWDPGYKKDKIINMDEFRKEARQLLKAGPHQSTPKPDPKPENPKTYRVNPGDTLWGIAEDRLGDGHRWLDLVKLNPSIARINPGEVLKLPLK